MRRRGIDSETARDLTQEYFTAFLEHEYLSQFDREKGRFKTFVLATVKHFLSKQDRRRKARKRGGGGVIVSSDVEELEADLTQPEDPETSFQRLWAESVLDQAMARLDSDEAELLRGYLDTDRRVNYSELARSRGLSETEVRNRLRRIRRRLRSLILEILQADSGEERDIEAEMQEIFLSL